MAEYIDNKTKLLGDDLKKELSESPQVEIIASVFTIYAFEALKEELEKVSELRFIFFFACLCPENVKWCRQETQGIHDIRGVLQDVPLWDFF